MATESVVKDLYDAVTEGNEEKFKGLKLDPFLLEKFADTCNGKTLLHIAAAEGHVEIASILLKKYPKMCWSRDGSGMNPIHVAAMHGRDNFLKTLVVKDDFAAMERLDLGETVLHLCVKHRQFGAFEVLVEKLGDFVSAEDDAGETVLHWAVRFKLFEFIEHLAYKTKIDKRSLNSKGQTPLKILKQSISYSKCDEVTNEIKRILRIPSPSTSNPPEDWLTKKRDSIMVVAILIATMAFQAAVSPTGGVWQDDTSSHRAGEAVMAYKDPNIYRNFMRSNTVAFVTSLSTILLLVIGLPFKYNFVMWPLIVIMWVSVTAVGVTYGASIMVATPKIHKKSLSHVIQIGVIAWVTLMTVLLVGNAIRRLYRWLSNTGRVPSLRATFRRCAPRADRIAL